MIIGVSGRKQNGKDTVGKIVQALLYKRNKNFKLSTAEQIQGTLFLNHSWKIKKFADTLKQRVALTFPSYFEIDLWESNYKEYRDEVIEELGMTRRKLLELEGTEVCRNIHPDYWVVSLMSEYKPKNQLTQIDYITGKGALHQKDLHPNWIITDTRFPNEVKAIKDKGGIVIRVNTNRCMILSNHESETALDGYRDFDYTIDNSGTIEELVEKVRGILIKEELI